MFTKLIDIYIYIYIYIYTRKSSFGRQNIYSGSGGQDLQ